MIYGFIFVAGMLSAPDRAEEFIVSSGKPFTMLISNAQVPILLAFDQGNVDLLVKHVESGTEWDAPYKQAGPEYVYLQDAGTLIVQPTELGIEGGRSVVLEEIARSDLKSLSNLSKKPTVSGDYASLIRKSTGVFVRALAQCAYGELLLDDGERHLASQQFREALDTLETTGHTDAYVACSTRNAFNQIGLGQFDEAASSLSGALSRDGISPSVLAAALNILGLAQHYAGDIESAEDNYEQAHVLFKRGGDNSSASLITINLGGICYVKGDSVCAEKRFSEALESFEKVGDEEHAASALSNLALVRRATGRSDLAISDYAHLLAYQSEAKYADDRARTERNIGVLKLQLGDAAAALPFLERAYQKQLSREHFHEATRTAAHLADALLALSRNLEAIEVLDHSLQFAESGQQVFNANLILSKSLETSSLEEAAARLEAVRELLPFVDNRSAIEFHIQDARVSALAGDFSEAQISVKRARGMALDAKQELLSVRAELTFLDGLLADPNARFVEVREAWIAADARVSGVARRIAGHDQVLAWSHAQRDTTAAWLRMQERFGSIDNMEAVDQLRRLKSRLATRFAPMRASMEVDGSRRRLLADARLASDRVANSTKSNMGSAIDQFEEAFLELSLHVRSEPQPPESVLEPLPGNPSTVYLFYFLHSEFSGLFAVRGGKVQFRPLNVTSDELELLVESAVDAVANPNTVAREVSTSLSTLSAVLVPGWLPLDGAEQIAVIADGPTYRVPFSALAWKGQTLVDRWTIRYTYAGLEQVDFSGPPNSAVAFVDADFARETGLPRLAWSRLEVPFIEAASESIRSISGINVTSSRVLSELSRPVDILHISTHGLQDELSGNIAGLHLAGSTKERVLNWWDMASKTVEANAVILNGCATVRGRYSAAYGYVGLPYALLRAGAKNVVSTAWSISDRAAIDFIDAFYAALSAGGTISEAVRSGQLKLRKTLRFRSPYYWAGYRNDQL